MLMHTRRGLEKGKWINWIIIRCKLFFLFVGRKPTTWPANNCLQIMVSSCAMLSNCVWLQIIFCSCVNKTMRDRSCVKKGRSLCFPKIFIKRQTWWLNDKTIIILLLNSLIAKLRDLPVSHINIIWCVRHWLFDNWSVRHWQITIFCSTSSNNC